LEKELETEFEKKFGSGKAKIGLVVCAVLVVILAISNVMMYVSLQNRVNALEIDNTNLHDQMNTLEAENTGLETQVNDLEAENTGLETQVNDLQTEVGNLQTETNQLENQLTTLQEDYEIEKALRIGNSLESYYDYLREELGPTGTKWWWAIDESIWQIQVDFAANLALHDLRLIYWPTLEEVYYEDVGEYSYDTAKKKVDEVVVLVEIEINDAATERIGKVLEFINTHIHYESEVNDIFLAPVESLGFKSGDCDDFSVLAAALFEAMEIDAAVGFFRNENDEYHAMVLVQLEELSGYSYWHYSDLTQIGLETGNWIVIEPQATIDNQGDNWIEQWSLLVAAPLDVD